MDILLLIGLKIKIRMNLFINRLEGYLWIRRCVSYWEAVQDI